MPLKRRKRRKRTNKNVPAKGRLRDMADKLWSLAVRDDWGNKCAVCGNETCEAHHLVPRQHEKTRYGLWNGIALCANHHQFDADISPHQNAAGWLKWLKGEYPERHKWYSDISESREYRNFTGTKNPPYYIGIIQGLREYVEPEDFERIVGIRFNRYLEEMEG